MYILYERAGGRLWYEAYRTADISALYVRKKMLESTRPNFDEDKIENEFGQEFEFVKSGSDCHLIPKRPAA